MAKAAWRLASVVLGSVVLTACVEAPLQRTERALELHVRGLEARRGGATSESAGLLVEACRLGHEHSCQPVWLQLDPSLTEPSPEALERLERTALRLAAVTDGAWFCHEGREATWVRPYYPADREGLLRGELSRLRLHGGG